MLTTHKSKQTARRYIWRKVPFLRNKEFAYYIQTTKKNEQTFINCKGCSYIYVHVENVCGTVLSACKHVIRKVVLSWGSMYRICYTDYVVHTCIYCMRLCMMVTALTGSTFPAETMLCTIPATTHTCYVITYMIKKSKVLSYAIKLLGVYPPLKIIHILHFCEIWYDLTHAPPGKVLGQILHTTTYTTHT